MANLPLHSYNLAELPLDSSRIRGSPARRITVAGRSGVHLPRIKGRVLIPAHTLNRPQGSLALWVMALDDIAPAQELPQHKISNPNSVVHTFLSDREAVQAFDAAHFHFSLHSHWHPVLMAKFYKGSFAEAIARAERKALASANYFEMERLQWYLMVLTWDRERGQYAIYANGVLVGTQDQTHAEPLLQERCGEFAYLGNPALVYSQLAFYDRTLDAAETAAIFGREALQPDTALQARLESRHAGRDVPPFDAGVAVNWPERFALPLNRPNDLEAFYIQGCQTAAAITPEGLRITTPPITEFYRFRINDENAPVEDHTRMYLWSNQTFEGDLYIRFEFKPLTRGGLCLLMVQAAGMQGEDFLTDYPLRTNGLMRTVCWEDVRNYHWEFYREMTDTRNDLASHACMKNPWLRPLAFRVENRSWELNRWYVVEFLQLGGRLAGAIDGRNVIAAEDRPFENSGPVLRNGRIALRCMMRTDVVVRNLSVRTRRDFEATPLLSVST